VYRVIVEYRRKEYEDILAMSDYPSYDYKYNSSYACITLSPEAFSIVILKYKTRPNVDSDGKEYCKEYEDMPSYALLSNEYDIDCEAW
jgi:hypothetical protein